MEKRDFDHGTRGSPTKPKRALAAISPSRWWSCCSPGRGAERHSHSSSWTSPPGAPRPAGPEPRASAGSPASCWGSCGSRAAPCLPGTRPCQPWYLGQAQRSVEHAAPAIISPMARSRDQVQSGSRAGGSRSEWMAIAAPLYFGFHQNVCLRVGVCE